MEIPVTFQRGFQVFTRLYAASHAIFFKDFSPVFTGSVPFQNGQQIEIHANRLFPVNPSVLLGSSW